jgi:hypothetical protein
MYRRTFTVGLVALVAGCNRSRGEFTPPRNLDDACAILRERPHYANAFARVERRWNVQTHILMAMIHQESRFDGDIRPPFTYTAGVIPMGRISSAYGYSQALDGTWEEYQRATGKRSAKRNRIKDASDFMGWYMNISRERNNISLTDVRRQYLAYHEGHTGYARGSYNSKPWLLEVAERVEERAETYRLQLASC